MSHKRWPASAVSAVLADPQLPSFACNAVRMALYTAQRASDICMMRWDDVKDGKIAITQRKTGATVYVALPGCLVKCGERYICGRSVFYIHPRTMGMTVKRALIRAGYPDLTFHGLRVTAACMLAEAGCTSKQIAALTGHRSIRILEGYIQDANNKVLAEQAQSALKQHPDWHNALPAL